MRFLSKSTTMLALLEQMRGLQYVEKNQSLNIYYLAY